MRRKSPAVVLSIRASLIGLLAAGHAGHAGTIDGESWRALTVEEHRAVGLAVGQIECMHENKWFTSTGFVVARDVILTSSHQFYSASGGRSTTRRYWRSFLPVEVCDFNIKRYDGRTISRIKLRYAESCGHRTDSNAHNCDWMLFKLAEPVPSEVTPLTLTSASPAQLIGRAISGVGFHDRPRVGRAVVTDRRPQLIDRGRVHAFAPGTVYARVPFRFAHDLDSNAGSSGQPILVRHGEQWRVVGIHSGQILPADDLGGGPFDARNRYGYATVIPSEALELLELMAPAERERLRGARKHALPAGTAASE